MGGRGVPLSSAGRDEARAGYVIVLKSDQVESKAWCQSMSVPGGCSCAGFMAKWQGTLRQQHGHPGLLRTAQASALRMAVLTKRAQAGWGPAPLGSLALLAVDFREIWVK